MSRPPPTRAAYGASVSSVSQRQQQPQPQQQLVSNSRGQQRIIGDPFAAPSGNDAVAPRPTSQINAYGHSVNAGGHTSGALQSRQQQAAMKSQDAAHMLLDALEKYGPAPGAQAMLGWERDAARHAISEGVYVTWRSDKGNDCTRVGPSSLCFCGHEYAAHGGPTNAGWKRNKMHCDANNGACPCANFNFIPRRPEECGEWWLVRRKEFDVRSYKAKCKCGHAHDEHDPKGMHACKQRCGCTSWHSAFLCVVCDRHSEDHSTVWETAAERISAGKPVGEEYMPFHEAPEIKRLVFDRTKDSLQPRPGEKNQRLRAGTGAGAAAAPSAGARKALTGGAAASAAAASPSAASSQPVRVGSARASRPSTSSSTTAAAASSSASGVARAAPARARQVDLENAFAQHSLHERDEQPEPERRAAPTASRSTPARALGQTSAVAAHSRATASSRPAASNSAAAARAQRLELEQQLAAQAKQSSSAFKPVFD